VEFSRRHVQSVMLSVTKGMGNELRRQILAAVHLRTGDAPVVSVTPDTSRRAKDSQVQAQTAGAINLSLTVPAVPNTPIQFQSDRVLATDRALLGNITSILNSQSSSE
jgi:hypothetical protein